MGIQGSGRVPAATTHAICRTLGTDTSNYSLGDVPSWSGGDDQAVAGRKGACERYTLRIALATGQ
jgi:hypothetical protein